MAVREAEALQVLALTSLFKLRRVSVERRNEFASTSVNHMLLKVSTALMGNLVYSMHHDRAERRAGASSVSDSTTAYTDL